MQNSRSLKEAFDSNFQGETRSPLELTWFDFCFHVYWVQTNVWYALFCCHILFNRKHSKMITLAHKSCVTTIVFSLDTLTLPLETSQLCVKTCLVSHLTGKGSKNRWPLGRSVIKKTNCSFLPFQWRQMVSIIWSLAIDMCTISVTSEGSTTCQTTITMNLVLKLTTGQPWKYLIL